jgi:hypothetical protein
MAGFLVANGQQFFHTDRRTSTYSNRVDDIQVKCWGDDRKDQSQGGYDLT